jgi:uncharacterized SAM-binding protein YcdF (DUF218 family)
MNGPLRVLRRFPRSFIAIGLAAAFILARRPLLTAAAHGWVKASPPAKADAIYILGGSVDARPFEAAKLYKEGYAPLVLIPVVETSPAQALGLAAGDTEAAFRILLSQGVPETAIKRIGKNVTSTYEESIALRDWCAAQASPPKTVLIPTEHLHTRRTAWVFHKLMPETVQCAIVAADHREFALGDWWQHEQGLITFQNEIIKTFYYFWKY